MRLIFTDPKRPQDMFVIGDRTDGDPLVNEGETFSVPDDSARQLLAAYHPRIQPAAKRQRAVAKPGKKANSIVTVPAEPVIPDRDEKLTGPASAKAAAPKKA